MENIIRTIIDPKEIRAKYVKLTVRDGDLNTTAYVEIFDEDYDESTKTFTMKIGLDYPRRTERGVVSLAIPARQDGKKVAIKRPDYVMTQNDFDMMIKGETVTVPTLY